MLVKKYTRFLCNKTHSLYLCIVKKKLGSAIYNNKKSENLLALFGVVRMRDERKMSQNISLSDS